jgi:hypothetical protein
VSKPDLDPNSNKLFWINLNPELKMKRERERERDELELAMEISLTSLGSSQTLPLPHLSTLAASRFWSFNDTIALLSSATGGFFANEIYKGLLYSTGRTF